MKQRHKRKQSDQHKHYRSLQAALRIVFRKNLKKAGNLNIAIVNTSTKQPIWDDADRLLVNVVLLKMKKYRKISK
jgi:hypothetical protein